MKTIQRLIMLCQIQRDIRKSTRATEKMAREIRRHGISHGAPIETLKLFLDELALLKEHRRLLMKHLFGR